MWKFLLALALAAGVASVARSDQTADLAACVTPGGPADNAQRITECSRLLDGGRLSKNDAAMVLNGRGQAYDDDGAYEKAISDYNQAIALKPDYSEAFNNRGVTYDNLGNGRQAIVDYAQAIRLDPQYAEAYGNRGGSYADLGDYERALDDLNRAVAISPEFAEAFNTRGNVHSDLGDYDAAIRDYDTAIELDPHYANAFNGRGNAYSYGKGEYEKAIEDYSRAIALNPEQHNARWARGVALFVLGHYPEAAESLAEHVSRKPDDPYGILLLYVARRHQQQDSAAELAQQAANLDLSDWPAPLLRLYQGKLSAAELDAKLAETQSLSPRVRCEADFYMGEMDLLEGRADQAKTRFENALSICPTDNGELSGARAELRRM